MTLTLDKTLNTDMGHQFAAIEDAVNTPVAETLKVGTGTKTATATAGAATLAKNSGKITSESLTTAAAASYTLAITSAGVAAGDAVFATLANGTNTQGIPVISRVTATANTITIVVFNLHASQALNGTLVVSYVVLKA